MNIKKGILIVISMLSLFFFTAFVKNKLEMKDFQIEEYKKVVIIAEQLLTELKIKRDDFKVIKIENLIINGDKFEGSHFWKITLKSKSLFGEEGQLIGKGGEVYIKVDLKTKKAHLLGYGE